MFDRPCHNAFYKMCLKACSQWRKIEDRLEDDERCSRLEKIDRLIGFEVSNFHQGVHVATLEFFF